MRAIFLLFVTCAWNLVPSHKNFEGFDPSFSAQFRARARQLAASCQRAPRFIGQKNLGANPFKNLCGQVLAALPHSVRIDDLFFFTDSERPQLKDGEAAVFPYSDEASVLLEKALEIKRMRGKEFDLAIDPFCGDGKSGLPLVFYSVAKKLIGSDINPRAIAYAKSNAETNHLESKSHFSIRDILKEGVSESDCPGNTIWIANPPFSLKIPGASVALMRDGGDNGLRLTTEFVSRALQASKQGDVILGIGYSRIRPDGTLELEEELAKMAKTYGATVRISLLEGHKLWRGFNGVKEQENPAVFSGEMFAQKADPLNLKEVEAYQKAAELHIQAGYNRLGYYYYLIEK